MGDDAKVDLDPVEEIVPMTSSAHQLLPHSIFRDFLINECIRDIENIAILTTYSLRETTNDRFLAY